MRPFCRMFKLSRRNSLRLALLLARAKRLNLVGFWIRIEVSAPLLCYRSPGASRQLSMTIV